VVRRAVLWFRRDLRLADHAALVAAAESYDEILAVFVLDDWLRRPAGPNRLAFLTDCLADLERATGGALVVRTGDPVVVVPDVVAEAGAEAVFVTADFGPYGARRDEAVAAVLDVPLHAVGSPYVVDPGVVERGPGRGYAVYSAYERAWRGYRPAPPLPVPSVRWARLETEGVPARPAAPAPGLPPGGEAAAQVHLGRVDLDGYADRRDLPGADGTTRLSPYLKFGCLHPRQVLARLGGAHEKLRKELVWREFLADVLHRQPESARRSLRTPPRADHGPVADERFAAWAEGRTGFPLVDAGMRQLLHEGWMHNRVRMVTASFLVKDLHLPWERGAAHFFHHLVDGDLASNQLNWQWVAGTGIDAAPFHRVFNPTLQAEKFDPDGSYVGRWAPGRVEPIVDHKAERIEALKRWDEATGR
jgi:deoxyribodipyrimidine photo-lyase